MHMKTESKEPEGASTGLNPIHLAAFKAGLYPFPDCRMHDAARGWERRGFREPYLVHASAGIVSRDGDCPGGRNQGAR